MDIVVKNLTKRFEDKLVLDQLNIVFKSGEFNAILGESGRGKTSLIRILMGLDLDFSGEILNLSDQISPVFQENRLLENYSIMDNINLVQETPLSQYFLEEKLELVGLDNPQTLVKNLSGGMKRRVAILRAVLKDSQVYIFDEPFKDMDYDTHLLVLDFVQRELRGRTLIFSSHSRLDLEILRPNIIEI